MTNRPAHTSEGSSQNTPQPWGQHPDVSYCYLYFIKTEHCLVITRSAHRSEKDPMIEHTLCDYSSNSVGRTAQHDQMGPQGMLRQMLSLLAGRLHPNKDEKFLRWQSPQCDLLALAQRGTDAERRVIVSSLRRLTSIRCTSICAKPQLFTD